MAGVPDLPGNLAEVLGRSNVNTAFWVEGGGEFFLGYDL